MNLNDCFKLLSTQGASRRERDLSALQSKIIHHSPDSLSSSNVEINGVKQNVTIISTQSYESKTLISLPGETFHLGAIVWWQSAPWMIVSLDMQDEVYTRATMTLCNYLLKWINKDGNIIERWCILEDKNNSGSSGIDDNEYLTVGDARIQVRLAKDEESRQITRDQRFLIDDEDVTGSGDVVAYEVTKIYRAGNLYRGEGTYRYILQECNRTSRDNTELMIADYYDIPYSPVKKDTLGEGYSLKILSNEGIVAINSSSEITVQIINNNTKEIANFDYEYSLEDPTGSVTVDMNEDKTLTVSVANNRKNIGKKFKITISVPEINLKDSIEMSIAGWY